MTLPSTFRHISLINGPIDMKPSANERELNSRKCGWFSARRFGLYRVVGGRRAPTHHRDYSDTFLKNVDALLPEQLNSWDQRSWEGRHPHSVPRPWVGLVLLSNGTRSILTLPLVEKRTNFYEKHTFQDAIDHELDPGNYCGLYNLKARVVCFKLWKYGVGPLDPLGDFSR